MEAREKLGEDRFHVVSKGLEFCRMVYGSEYSKLVILVMYARVVAMRQHMITTGGVLVAEVPSRAGIVPSVDAGSSKTRWLVLLLFSIENVGTYPSSGKFRSPKEKLRTLSAY